MTASHLNFPMIERLPLELLQLILQHGPVASMKPDLYTLKSNGPIYPPLMVSMRWHNAAISCPQLWISITLEAPMRSSLLVTWLARSGTLPLHLNISFDFLNERDIRHLDIITEHIARWVTLKWESHSQIDVGHIYPHLSRATALRELQFTGENFCIGSKTNGRECLLPYLSRLTLIMVDLKSCPTFGGPSVTALLLDCAITAEELNLISRANPNLRELHLEDVVFYGHTDQLDDGLFGSIKSLKFHYPEIEHDELLLFLWLLRSTANNLKQLSFRVFEFRGGKCASRELSQVQKALESLPSNLKVLEIFFGQPAVSAAWSLMQRSRTLEADTLVRLRNINRLESLVMRFGAY